MYVYYGPVALFIELICCCWWLCCCCCCFTHRYRQFVYRFTSHLNEIICNGQRVIYCIAGDAFWDGVDADTLNSFILVFPLPLYYLCQLIKINNLFRNSIYRYTTTLRMSFLSGINFIIMCLSILPLKEILFSLEYL